MSTCIANGCSNQKVPGRGRRYCESCQSVSSAQQRQKATERTRAWRERNPEQYRQSSRLHYEATAEAQRERARAWHHANPDRVRARRVAQRAKRLPRVGKYGLTVEQYRGLLAAQNGGCAICGRTENGARHNFDVDHCHETGRVRGLLCNRCNRLLSNAQDDIEILSRAAAYLGGPS